MGDTEWGNYGRRPARVLAAVAFIDAVDRGILPGVLTKVQDDLGFSDTQAGLLGTAFVLTGFLVVLPAGYFADRHRRTRIIAVVLASWGVISGLNALVRNFWQFLLVRATLGIGETIDNPASQSLIADYYPSDVRGRAFALQRATPFFGQALGLGVAGGVAAVLSWRWAVLPPRRRAGLVAGHRHVAPPRAAAGRERPGDRGAARGPATGVRPGRAGP
jgi:MFS family permease